MLLVYLQILQLSYRPVSSAINLASHTIICDYDATVLILASDTFPRIAMETKSRSHFHLHELSKAFQCIQSKTQTYDLQEP